MSHRKKQEVHFLLKSKPFSLKSKSIFIHLVLVICLIFSSISESHATHAMGMELSYRSLGGLDYEFTINFYRDCNSGFGAPGSMNLQINSASCGVGTSTNLALISGPLDITPLCPSQTSNCSGGTNPGVEQYVYQGTFTLPSACADYVFSYELANRNTIVTNLVSPDSE
ncbi:MAG: hypothetical protein JKY54_11580 [Flavobacteriales bacterium]|nr:hypothetical protein [Flavobacteriales bacterium]